MYFTLQTEFHEIIDLPDPDKTSISERSMLRASQESEDFSDDHYLADWAQPEMMEPFLMHKAQWESCSPGWLPLFVLLLYEGSSERVPI